MTVRQTFMRLLGPGSPIGMTFEDWKPIIRCAVAAWLGLVLILVPRTLKVLGQASFLAFLVSCAGPPTGSVVKVLYESAYDVLFAGLSWLWYVIASRAAVKARSHTYTPASLSIPNVDQYSCASTPAECLTTAIFNGEFIEGRSSLIFAVFLYFGAAFFFWVKVKFTNRAITVIIGQIALVILFAYGPLFPYWNPELGQIVFIPMACQSAINIGCALVFWPRSVNHEYTKQIQALLLSIQKLTRMQREVLNSDPRNTSEWEQHATIKDQVRAVRTGLAAFVSNEYLLNREFQYGRFSASDLRSLTLACRDVILKLGGFSLFYDLVTHHTQAWKLKVDSGLGTSTRPSSEDLANEKELEDHDRENCVTGEHAPPTSGNVTPLTTDDIVEEPAREDLTDTGQNNGFRNRNAEGDRATAMHSHERKHAHFKKSKPPKHGILHDALHHVYKPVGVFEMHDFTEREAKFPRQVEVEYLVRMMAIAAESTSELFAAIFAALEADRNFLQLANKCRIIETVLLRRKRLSNSTELESARISLHLALADYKRSGRLQMLEPYAAGYTTGEMPHRPLMRMFYLEFHLVRFADSILKLTQRCLDLDLKHPNPHWHFPTAFFNWDVGTYKRTEPQASRRDSDHNDEAEEHLLGDDSYQTEVRDPDHEPARHWYHLIGHAVARIFAIFRHPTFFFVSKAALLVVLIALPAILRRTAGWFYHQRGVWTIIMVSFTQAPFTGDVAFSFIWRIFGTFFGAVSAITMWYMGNGSGQGQPYGLAAVMVPGFILLLYIRLRWVYITAQPAIILCLTNALIIGYSWQDSHLPSAVNLGIGWDIAWRRFVVVCVGISAAFIWSFFPRPVTGRQVIRRKLAVGAFNIGNIFVAVSNLARNPDRKKAHEEEIRQMVVRAYAKLLALNVRLQFAKYEPPIQGPWPKDKYQQILNFQRELLDLMNAFVNNLMNMDQEWIGPLLRRNGWQDRELISDCLAVLFMTSNAIRTGSALPQLVPSPLLDRFYEKLDHLQETESEDTLPKFVTRATLELPGYASFAVGSVITLSIVHRIDRLLLVVKELVGEVWPTTNFAEYQNHHRVNVV